MNILKRLSRLFDDGGDKEIITTPESENDTIGREKNWDDIFLKAKAYNSLTGNGVTEPYSQSAWVYRAVNSISSNIPQAPFRIYDSNKQPLPETNSIVQLFQNPNPFQSYFEWMESIVSFLNLNGEAFIYMVPSIGQRIGTRNLPAELWSLNPKLVQHAEDEGRIVGWTYGNMPIELDEMIHLKMFNPSHSSFRGMSPITALRQELEADFSAAKFNNSFFKNGAVPNGVITTDKEVQIDIKTLRKLKKEWYSNHGGAENAHKTAFLLNGMKYNTMQITQKDMEWMEGRKFSRESIMAIFGVNSFVAGFYSDGTITRATALASMRAFWENTLIPQMIRIEQKLKSKFFMRFSNDGTCGRFDTSEIPAFQAMFTENVDAAQKLFQIGHTRNEINQRLNLQMPEDDIDGDIRYLPMNLVPIGEDEGGVPEKSIEPKVEKAEKQNMIQRNYLIIQGKMEKKFESKLKRYLFDLRKEALRIVNNVQKALTADEEAELMALLNGLFDGGELQVAMEPVYTETARQAGEHAFDVLGITREFIINENVLKARMNYIKGVNDTLFEEIRSNVYEGIKSGETIPEISSRVKSSFNVASNRAKIIARTETASLMSAQTQDVYKSEGVKMKQWIATIDEKTRESHIQQNGQIVPMNTAFSNGLMFPGDSDNGPPEEVINCRCVLVPVVEV